MNYGYEGDPVVQETGAKGWCRRKHGRCKEGSTWGLSGRGPVKYGSNSGLGRVVQIYTVDGQVLGLFFQLVSVEVELTNQSTSARLAGS